jgi:hypothetical protein
MTCSGDGDIIIIIIGVEQREMCRVLGGGGSPRAWQKGSAAGVHQGLGRRARRQGFTKGLAEGLGGRGSPRANNRTGCI